MARRGGRYRRAQGRSLPLYGVRRPVLRRGPTPTPRREVPVLKEEVLRPPVENPGS
jgi:hypothetical protein